MGVVDFAIALQKAQEASLDLVEISPDSAPPVCRLMNYSKRMFDRKKKMSGGKQKRAQVKGMNFRPNTDIGDYNVKLKKITKFIEQSHKVKIVLRFRGRELQHRELGIELLKRIENDLGSLIVIEQAPKLEGKQILMVIAPAKK